MSAAKMRAALEQQYENLYYDYTAPMFHECGMVMVDLETSGEVICVCCDDNLSEAEAAEANFLLRIGYENLPRCEDCGWLLASVQSSHGWDDCCINCLSRYIPMEMLQGWTCFHEFLLEHGGTQALISMLLEPRERRVA